VRVPLLDLARSNAASKAAVDERVSRVFESQHFVLGPAVEDFEKAIAGYLGCKHAIGMSSGTDAELAILMALGIGPGDAVITTPFTFFATAGCIHRVGAEPVFVDIDADTFNLDPRALGKFLEEGCRKDPQGRLISPSGAVVRAIMPVHLFGTCARMDEINALARPYRLPVIEDASQAIGCEYPGATGAKKAGDLATAAFFSFFPTKNLGGAGDGGLAVCQDDELAAKLKLMRNHGMEQRYYHRVVGGNFRLDAVQAAVLHAKLPYLEDWNEARRENANAYRKAIEAAGLTEMLQLPAEPWRASGLKNHHIYHQYVVRAARRDELMKHLEKEQVGHGVYYPVPLHLQECFESLGYREGDFPQAERATGEVLALPIFPGLTEVEITAAVDAIARFYAA
jgi:dTDP-4-amino-4,6-dideoxygalactose transaminase